MPCRGSIITCPRRLPAIRDRQYAVTLGHAPGEKAKRCPFPVCIGRWHKARILQIRLVDDKGHDKTQVVRGQATGLAGMGRAGVHRRGIAAAEKQRYLHKARSLAEEGDGESLRLFYGARPSAIPSLRSALETSFSAVTTCRATRLFTSTRLGRKQKRKRRFTSGTACRWGAP